MRKIIIAGNWKMNKTSLEAIDLATALKRELLDIMEVDIVICPPFTSLSEVHEVLNESNIAVGAQNLFWENSGAFTGEVSASMIKDTGASYVLIGHSERRQYFGETNETVNKKIFAAFECGLNPIVCIGENLKEREQNKTFEVIRHQFEGSFASLTNQDIEKIIIAYEPVWAIGTGKTATPAQTQEVHQFIRGLILTSFNKDIAQNLRIQYGGSVTTENIADLISQADIDGALVGGASLKSDSFSKIVKSCCGIFK